MSMLSNKQYKSIFSKVPRACVDLIISDQNHGVLLVRRASAPFVGKWSIPGGRIRFGESVQDAARRIAISELGIDVVCGNFCGYMEFFKEKADGFLQHSISIAIFAKTAGISNGKYFKVAPNDMIPAHKKFLKKNSLIK